MKKMKYWFNKLICVLLITVSFTNAAYSDYNVSVVNAAELVTTMEIFQALLEMFGVSVGLGTQSDYFSQSAFEDFATAVSNGTVYHMDKYGDVDFSDDTSVRDWLEWANGIDEYITTSGWSPMTKYDASIKAGAGIIDYASYKITGTSATTAMHGYIDDLIDLFGVSGGGTISLDARDAYSFFGGAGAGDNDDDDDEAKKKERYLTRFTYFTGLTGAMILTMGDSLTELVGLVHPDTSDFSEYDAAFEDTYFDGAYTINADGQYVYKLFDSNGIYQNNVLKPYIIDTTLNYKIVAYKSGSFIQFCSALNNVIYLPVKDLNMSMQAMSSDGFHGNIPLYSSYALAAAALEADDFSDAENIVQNPYMIFKDNAKSAAARIPRHLKSWIMSPDYLNNLPSIIRPALDAADSSAGMTDSIDAIEDAVKALAPDDTIDEPVPDNPNDYSNILGRILSVLKSILTAVLAIPTAIMELPDTIYECFKNPIDSVIAALSSILDAILALPVFILELPDTVYECFKDPIDSIIAALSGILNAILDLPVFIMELPDTIYECFKNPIDSIIAALTGILDVILKLPVIIMDLPTMVFECFKDPVAVLGAIPNYLQDLLDGVLDICDVLDILVSLLTPIPAIVTLLTDLQVWLDAQWADLLATLDSIAANPKLDSPLFDEPGVPHVSLLNGLMLLVYILFMLLRIFLHLLEFIINIFKIPASPGFITGDFALGFNYIKSVDLEGMGVSIYDFLMGLIHIIIMFNVVKLLRKRIEKFHL